jgi:hypothetical protein
MRLGLMPYPAAMTPQHAEVATESDSVRCEILFRPEDVIQQCAELNVAITDPFYSAIFHYTNSAENDGHPFILVYEAGVSLIDHDTPACRGSDRKRLCQV